VVSSPDEHVADEAPAPGRRVAGTDAADWLAPVVPLGKPDPSPRHRREDCSPELALRSS
jgi:hypothetical protein